MLKKLPAAHEWRTDFAIEGNPELFLVRFKFQPWKFHVMERHLNVTQSFLPLGGKPIIMVVAPPTNPRDWKAVPKPEDVRAFVTDGVQGIMMWKGTWHGVYRFPVYPPHVDIAAVSAIETTEDLLKAGDRTGKAFMGVTPGKLSQRVDYKERFGVTFELVW